MERPALYVAFKSTGREVNFESDLAEQLNFGEESSGMIAEIIRAIKKINYINEKPFRFQTKCFLINGLCFVAYYLTYMS